MATGSVGSIFVDLLLRDERYNSGLNKARTNTNQVVKSITNDLKGLATMFASAFTVSKLVEYSDTYRAIGGRLSIVSGSMEQVTAAQQRLLDIAQETRQPLESVANLYTRLVQFTPDSERGMYDYFTVVKNVGTALAVTGEETLSAKAAMIQFTQAIGTNFESAGQELRSLQEQAPRLAQALVNSLGGGVKSLQTLKDEGKLTRQSILNALGGIGDEGKKLAEELSKMPVTVRQAFNRLNNAILDFVGNSTTAREGFSLLAEAISGLANNFGNLAKVISITAVGAITVFSAAQIKLIAANVATAAAATKTALAFGAVIGQSAIGTASFLAFASASRVLGVAMSAIGGPIGLAFLAVTTAFILHTNKAVEANKRYSEIINQVSSDYIKYTNASAEAKDSILADSQARVEALKKEIETIVALNQRMIEIGKRNVLQLGLREFLGKVGIGTAPSEIIEQYEAAVKALAEVESKMGEFGKSRQAQQIANQKELERIYKKYETAIRGVTKETISLEQAEKELNKLREAGKLTQEEMTEALKRYENELKGVDDYAKRAAQNIQDAFADFLFEPFKDGVDGMVESFGKMILKMLAQAQAAQLARAMFGDLVNGGTGTGMFGSMLTDFFGSFSGFFATGGTIPFGKWGVVGENGPEIAKGGSSGTDIIPLSKLSAGGGGGLTVNVINNNNSSVQTRAGTNGADLDILIDQSMAQKIGTPGTATNGALGAYNSRGLIRR